MINKDDPSFEDKLINLVISKIVNNEPDKEIVVYLQSEFLFKEYKAKDVLRKAKRTLKYYKSSDIEVAVKIHSQRYELIAEYCRKFGMPNLLLRTVKAHCTLLGMGQGQMGVAMRGGSVIAIDQQSAASSSNMSSEELLTQLSDEDRRFLRGVLRKMKR